MHRQTKEDDKESDWVISCQPAVSLHKMQETNTGKKVKKGISEVEPIDGEQKEWVLTICQLINVYYYRQMV